MIIKKHFTLNKVKLINTIIFLILIIQNQYAKILGDVEPYIEKIISFIPIIIAMLFLFYSMTKKKKPAAVKEGKEIIKIYTQYFELLFISVLLALVFNRFAIDIYGFRFWTRFIDKLLLRISSIIIVVSSWEINKDECLDSLKNALIIDGFLIILLSIFRNGVITTAAGILASLNLFEENAATAILEIHEATFVIGLLILYYLFFDTSAKKKKGTVIILSFLFIAGGKRIAFLALIIASIFAIIMRQRVKKNTIIFTGMIGIIVSCLYIWFLYSGIFFAISRSFEIDIKNRDLIYGFFIRRTELSPLYFGWGFSSVSRVIENMDLNEVKWMVVVRGLHCDILKQYIEFGFLGFIYWLYFILIHLPNKLYSKFGKNSALVYMVLIIYTFLTYLTDNTEGYFLFQSTLMLLPLANRITESNKK